MGGIKFLNMAVWLAVAAALRCVCDSGLLFFGKRSTPSYLLAARVVVSLEARTARMSGSLCFKHSSAAAVSQPIKFDDLGYFLLIQKCHLFDKIVIGLDRSRA